MKALRWFLTAFLLLIFAGLATPRAHADDWETIARISDYIHTYGNEADFPTYSEFMGLHDLFVCLDQVSSVDDVPGCFALIGNTNNAWLDSIQRLVQFYVDVDTGNYPDLVYQFGREFGMDAQCIVADILTSGGTGTLCELALEIVNLIVDEYKYVWDFLKDAAAAVGEVVSDLECWVSDCDKQSPLEVAYNYYYRGAEVDGTGLSWRLNPDPGYFDTALKASITNSIANLNTDIPGGFICPDPAHPGMSYSALKCVGIKESDIGVSANVFSNAINQQWDASILDPITGSWYKMQTVRGQWLGDDQTRRIFNLATFDYLHGDQKGFLPINDECVSQFKLQNPQFANIDHWFDVVTTDQANTAKHNLQNTVYWCLNTFTNSRPQKLFPLFAEFLGSSLHCTVPGGVLANGKDTTFICQDQAAESKCNTLLVPLIANGLPEGVKCVHELPPPPCPIFMGGYYCSSQIAYAQCLNWAKGRPVTNAAMPLCSYDTSVDGPEVARSIAQQLMNGQLDPANNLNGPPSKLAGHCTVDGKPIEATDQPATVAQHYAGSTGAQTKPAGAQQGMAGLNTSMIPPTGPSALDCPRPSLKHYCEILYKDRTASPDTAPPSQLVSCTADHLDAAYQQLAARVDAYARANANIKRTYDPLVIVGPAVLGANCPQGFNCVTRLVPSADGEDQPTLVLVGAATPATPNPAAMNAVPNPTPPSSQADRVGQLPGRVVPAPAPPQVEGRIPGAITLPAGAAPAPSNNPPNAAQSQAALADFNKWAGFWNSRVIVQPPVPACSCAQFYGQIDAIDQKSAGLLRSGNELSAMLSSGKLDADGTNKAALSLNSITKQLNDALIERHQLVVQYSALRQGKR